MKFISINKKNEGNTFGNLYLIDFYINPVILYDWKYYKINSFNKNL